MSGLWGAVRGEWIKLWSVRSTWRCAGAAVVLSALWAGVVGFDYSYEDAAHPAPTEPFPVGDAAVAGAQLAQFATMALAMLVVTGEYASGAIRSTLQSVPGRSRLVVAKSVVAGAVVFVLGLVLAGVGAASGGVLLDRLAEVEPADLAARLPAIAGYLALTGLFTVGVGFLVRSAAGTLSIALAVLVVLPLLTRGIDVAAVEAVADVLPGAAGMRLLDGDGETYGPGTAAVLLAGWAVAALVGGWQALRRRDA